MKKLKELSLVLSGFILGVGVLYAPTIYAATSNLLGTKVDKVMTVKLDNKKIGDAVVIKGVSYLPVRATANAFNAEVAVNSTEINLTSEDDIDPGFSVTPEEEKVDIVALSAEIRVLKKNIQNAKDVLSNKASGERSIASKEETIQMLYRMRDTNTPGYSEEKVTNIQAQINKTKKNLSDAETNLPIWEAELAVLEAELSTLQ